MRYEGTVCYFFSVQGYTTQRQTCSIEGGIYRVNREETDIANTTQREIAGGIQRQREDRPYSICTQLARPTERMNRRERQSEREKWRIRDREQYKRERAVLNDRVTKLCRQHQTEREREGCN